MKGPLIPVLLLITTLLLELLILWHFTYISNSGLEIPISCGDTACCVIIGAFPEHFNDCGLFALPSAKMFCGVRSRPRLKVLSSELISTSLISFHICVGSSWFIHSLWGVCEDNQMHCKLSWFMTNWLVRKKANNNQPNNNQPTKQQQSTTNQLQEGEWRTGYNSYSIFLDSLFIERFLECLESFLSFFSACFSSTRRGIRQENWEDHQSEENGCHHWYFPEFAFSLLTRLRVRINKNVKQATENCEVMIMEIKWWKIQHEAEEQNQQTEFTPHITHHHTFSEERKKKQY